ncbi:hypothetical protein CDL15_Pgr001111 [Punica granatum]|uniref:Uncharacterized protein n=1 Tax=Punica granatum TaxID=22663 RepID=A0A218WJI7_PUNGR|nr:hypothetical protein CDL15_Pgr001111 [Punica granatum]
MKNNRKNLEDALQFPLESRGFRKRRRRIRGGGEDELMKNNNRKSRRGSEELGKKTTRVFPEFNSAALHSDRFLIFCNSARVGRKEFGSNSA